ncbi:uncharacterized protein BJ212DRAFT_1306943, partial [Suillus subaureus]
IDWGSREIHNRQDETQATIGIKKIEEKERVLANMKRRFARRGGQQEEDVEMNVDPALRSAQQQPKIPQKPLSGTPCLNTTKRFKKIRGTSHRTRLVSLVTDQDDPVGKCAEETPTDTLVEGCKVDNKAMVQRNEI